MRLPNAMHLLHALWQFIACDVGTRFIASAGVGRGLAATRSAAPPVGVHVQLARLPVQR